MRVRAAAQVGERRDRHISMNLPHDTLPNLQHETTPDAILRFLDSIGRRSEAEFYLSLFRAESKERFANLVVDSNVLCDALEAVVLDLRFLHGLGLVPVVTLGLYTEGARGEAYAQRLQSRLERDDVAAEVFAAERADLADGVAASARAGRIPIVAFTTGGPGDVRCRFDALGRLSSALQTRKLIFVTRRGALRTKKDTLLWFINLATDYDKLLAEKALTPKQQFLVTHARRLLLEWASHPMLIAVTSPLQLLRELFTVKGAGTMIKRGSIIVRKTGYAEVDRDRLVALLTSSFGRVPAPRLFEGDEVPRVYLEENYRGVALVFDTPLGGYLSKFAVERAAQGEGIGRDLWQLLTADSPCLFWRARPKNPIGAFYIQECDGMARFAEWNVFWKGLAPERIPEAIALSLGHPIDFIDHGAPENSPPQSAPRGSAR